MIKLTITILKRYDINGAFTHDIDIIHSDFTPPENSMWRVAKKIEVEI